MGRTLRVLTDFKWVVVRAPIWIGATAFSAAQGRWLAAGVVFVAVGGSFWIWGTTLFLVWRRDRREVRDRTQSA